MTLLKLSGIDCSYGGFEPLLTRDKDIIKNKCDYDKIMNTHDINALFGALYFLCKYNDIDPNTILENAAIQGNKLYLNSFEGYYINDRLSLQALYFNQYNVLIGLVYDNKVDKYLYFIMQ